MAFASILLTFLTNNKDKFGWYCAINDTFFETHVSNIDEYIALTDVINDWRDNCEEIINDVISSPSDQYLSLLIWERHIGNHDPLEDMYSLLTDLPETEYIFIRRHPNGIISLEFSLVKNKGNNYEVIKANIATL